MNAKTPNLNHEGAITKIRNVIVARDFRSGYCSEDQKRMTVRGLVDHIGVAARTLSSGLRCQRKWR